MPLYPIKIVLIQILVWICILPARGQHKAWQQYTIDDGLAGNEVFDALQDKKGFIWFVTDQGICKFNGYEFIRPMDTSAFAGNEAFTPTEDEEGRIWFARLDKTLWIIQNDTVRPWRYNHILNLYKEKFGLIDQLAVDENKAVWIALRGYGFLVVDSMANHTIFRGSENHNILFTKIRENVISALQLWKPPGESITVSDSLDAIFLHGGKLIRIKRLQKSKYFKDLGSAWLLGNEDLVLAYNLQFEIFNEGGSKTKMPSEFYNPKIYETADNKILVASYVGDKTGLFLYESMRDFQQGLNENILPGYKASDILIDHQEGWWATTLDGGVFYCKNPDINIYDKSAGFSSSNVIRLTTDGRRHLYAAIEDGAIWKINPNTSPEALPKPAFTSGDISALHYDTIHNRLWSSPLKYFEDEKWNAVLNPITGSISEVVIKKFSTASKGKNIWVSASYGFYNFDNESLQLKYFKESKINQSALRTFAVVEDKENNLWVATIDGLKLWINDHYENPPFTHPVLRFQARDIELMKDGSLAIAFRGGGILIKEVNGNLHHLTKENGLSSNYITKVYTSPEGEVYACSNEGLNLLTHQDNIWRIELITTKQGLPSNLINDVCMLNGELWIATQKGLAHIKKKPVIHPVTTPILERFIVNNRDSVYTQPMRLPYDQNNISLKFYALHFRSEGEIQYRYRLLNADTLYTLSKNREVSFLNLAPGKYEFEVQAQNADATWSPAAHWSFEIRNPWWLSTWFFVLSAILLGIAITLFMRFRLKAIKEKAAINNKIKDLEMAALRAQMNPHFIFNCLGSIQQFIIENDSASASRYLARFAKLIRLSLHSSVDGKHSLSDEIEMLDNYLALEQMRFKKKFSYTISTEPDIHIDEVFLAPMLIQPFVENAILHGMNNKSEGGLINIHFLMKDGAMQVAVTDNGPGFSSNQSGKLKSHKSFGMSLTKKRLHLLTNSGEGNTFTTDTLTGPDGEVTGSKVLISIPLE